MQHRLAANDPVLQLGALSLALLAASVPFDSLAVPAATLTEFTLDTGVAGVTSGTFETGSGVLFNLASLAGSGNTRNFAAQVFTPSASDTYTFGMSSAPVDTVLVVYQNSYDPTSPTVNAVALSDDSDGAGAGGVTMGTCGGAASLCPKLTENLDAGTDYHVVVTTFGAGVALPFPLGFYVFGQPVAVGGAAAPAPAPLSVLGSSRQLLNGPAFGAAAVIDATPALLQAFTDANLSTDQEISQAATQTLPLLLGAAPQVIFNALGNTNRIVQARLDANRGMSAGDAALMDEHAWVKVFGTHHDQDDEGGVTGYGGKSAGLALGADADLYGSTRLGLAFAYAQTDISSNTKLNRADIDSFQLVGYGSHAVDERTEINFQADLGLSRIDGERFLTSPVVGSARSEYDSLSFHVGTGIGRAFDLGSGTQLVPSARVDYTRIRSERYTETGSTAAVNPFLNRVQAETTETLELGVGARLSHRFDERTAVSANVGVAYDAINEAATITSSFVGGGASFTTTGIRPDRWIKRAGLGLTHTLDNGAEVSARYDAHVRTGLLDQTASVRVRWAF